MHTQNAGHEQCKQTWETALLQPHCMCTTVHCTPTVNLLEPLVNVLQSISHVWLFATLWTAAHPASLSFTISQSLLKLMFIELVMPSYVTLYSSCPRSFPASGSFSMSPLFTSDGQSIGVSASVFPRNVHGWIPLGVTGLISLLSKGLSRVFSSTKFESISYSALNLLYGPTLKSVCDYWKNHSFDYTDLC